MIDAGRLPAVRILRYGVVGLSAAAVHGLVFIWLVEAVGATGLIANLIGFAVAVVVSFVGQSRWTFADSAAPGAFARFVVSSGIGLSLNSLAAWTIVDWLGLAGYWVLPFLLVIVPSIVFLILRFWVFPAASPTRRADRPR